MSCNERGMLRSTRSSQGQLVLDGRRRERLPSLMRFAIAHLQIDPTLSVLNRELEAAYEQWSGQRVDRSGDMHNLCEFLTLWCGAEECERPGGRDRIFFGVGLRP